MAIRSAAKRAQPRDYNQPAPARSIPTPAPSLGMNTRDSVSSLDPREARSIRNMVAEQGKCRIRKGKEEYTTIAGATSTGTMFTHEGVDANAMLVAAGGEIYDITTDTPSALTSASYNSDNWCIAQFNDTSIAVNGVDTPWSFNGTAVGATGFTGVGLTIENLRTVQVVRGSRLWFTEVESADVWYGAPNAISGTLTKFQLSQETTGGYCVGVYGYRNSTVFVMSTGQIVAYQGDVEDTAAFTQSGDYRAPKPVGYDPGKDVSGDLVLMTVSGAQPYEYIASGVAFDTQALREWGKIAPSWATDFVTYGFMTQWNAIFAQGLVIFNLPTSETESKQWVFNTRTRAWSFFDNLNGFSFTELDGVLYFGDRGTNQIWRYTGGQDDGTAIVSTIRGGFTYPLGAQVNGFFTLGRADVTGSGTVTVQLQVDVDFQELGITATEIDLITNGSGPWDGPWDGPWGTAGVPILKWFGISGYGRAVAPVVQFNSNTEDLEYLATNLLVNPAGIIG